MAEADEDTLRETQHEKAFRCDANTYNFHPKRVHPRVSARGIGETS